MTTLPKAIQITEVGPRDGLQNQSVVVSTQGKINWINALSETGIKKIETTAFVSPKWVPQLADSTEVFEGISKVDGVCYTALVPNEMGWARALEAGVEEVAVITSASESFCEKNTNTTIEGSIERIIPIVKSAISHGVDVRCYISCVVACPYEGQIDLSVVSEITEKMLDIGVHSIDLGETIGVASPTDICRLYDALDGVLSPSESILHLHNTNGKALDCMQEAMVCGVVQFDTSSGGLGGCPYAPGAAGNLATEDLVAFADERGIETGINFQELVRASAMIESELRCLLPSRAYRKFQDAKILPNE
jgi:hydroxymethylglutaryl-CoA lyase